MKNLEPLSTSKPMNYMERKRLAVLNLGYDFVVFRNRTKKSLMTLKKQIGHLSL